MSKTEQAKTQEVINLYLSQISDPGLVAEIVANGRVKRYKQDEILLDMGQPLDEMPLLAFGLLKVIREDEDGREVLLYYLEGGATCSFSLSCCMGSKESRVRVQAEEESLVIWVPVRFMDEWLVRYPFWRMYVINSFSNRMENMLGTIDQLAFRKMDERLMYYLREQSSVKNDREIRRSHAQIASDLNSSREVVSRLLKQLEQDGKVALGRNLVVLKED